MSGFYEFFAGGGMVRAGLGSGWSCLFATDVTFKKAPRVRPNPSEKQKNLPMEGDPSEKKGSS